MKNRAMLSVKAKLPFMSIYGFAHFLERRHLDLMILSNAYDIKAFDSIFLQNISCLRYI